MFIAFCIRIGYAVVMTFLICNGAHITSATLGWGLFMASYCLAGIIEPILQEDPRDRRP